MNALRPGGYTLLELLAVVAILSIAALVAIPSSHPVAEARADAAAGEVALALKFARDDARRTGQQRLFGCDQALNRIMVRPTASAGPDTVVSSAYVDHPASRAPYLVRLASTPAGNTMALTRCTFTFADNTSAATVVFDEDGNPVRGLGKAAMRTQVLHSGTVVLGAGNATRTVVVDTAGRITIRDDA